MGTEIARLDSMPVWARAALEKYADTARYELLLPALPVDSQLGWGYAPSVSVITIDDNPLNGEVFKVGSRKNGNEWVDLYAYAKPGLLKLASAAGIHIRTERVDGRRNSDYCEVRAIGAMRTETGQPMMRTGTKAFFMPDVSNEAWRSRVDKNKKLKSNEQKTEVELRQAHDGEMLSFRKHLLRRTEAGAITAVIRELLATKGGQTREQIAKPKVLIRVDFRPDHNDPVVKRFLMHQADAATRSLYGPQHLSTAAEVIEDLPPDHETLEAREHAAAALPATASTPQPVVEPTEEEIIADVERGCDILGLNLLQRNDLFTTHKNDLRAMLKDLNARVDKMQSGEN